MRPISNLNTSAATYIPPQQLPSSCLETLTLLVQMNNYIKRDADYSTGMAVAPLVPGSLAGCCDDNRTASTSVPTGGKCK